MTQFNVLSLSVVLSVILVNSVACNDIIGGYKEALDGLTLNVDFLQTAFISGLKRNLGNDSFWVRETDNSLCRDQLAYMMENKYQRDVFRFFDSWGRLPSGLLYGHIEDFGNYDQCVEIRSDLGSEEPAQGKYCKALVPVASIPISSRDMNKVHIEFMMLYGREIQNEENGNNFVVNVRIGLCIPASCREELASEILQQETGVKVRLANCKTNDRPQFSALDIVAIVLFSSIAVMMLLSSVYDYITLRTQTPRKPLYLAFSVLTNSRKLFHISTTKNPAAIDCLNGIRVITMIWIIFGHSYANSPALPLTNLIKIVDWLQTFYSLTLQMSPIAVDTFFFLGGMLIAWMGLKEMTKTNGKLNIPMMYIHRVVRIIPLLAIMILFSLTLYDHLGDGPLWSMYKLVTVDGCKHNWWRTLLFIQNYSHTENMCLGHTWYLAIDMQLYILSPLFLFALYKWGKKVLPVLGILCLLSAGCAFAIFYKYDLKSLRLLPQGIRWSKAYVPTHIRYSPWMIGLGFGYLMFEYRNHKVNIPKPIVIIGWLASLATLLAVVYGPYKTIKLGYEATVLASVSYEQFSKIGWSFALCWIIFACHYGYGGQINSILSYPFWQVLVRLSYSMYMIHMIVLAVICGKVQTDVYFSNFIVICLFWSAFGITLIFSVLLVLAIESPIIALEKILLHKDMKGNSNAVGKTISQEVLTEKFKESCREH